MDLTGPSPLVTNRNPGDLPSFTRKLAEVFGG